MKSPKGTLTIRKHVGNDPVLPSIVTKKFGYQILYKARILRNGVTLAYYGLPKDAVRVSLDKLEKHRGKR